MKKLNLTFESWHYIGYSFLTLLTLNICRENNFLDLLITKKTKLKPINANSSFSITKESERDKTNQRHGQGFHRSKGSSRKWWVGPWLFEPNNSWQLLVLNPDPITRRRHCVAKWLSKQTTSKRIIYKVTSLIPSSRRVTEKELEMRKGSINSQVIE